MDWAAEDGHLIDPICVQANRFPAASIGCPGHLLSAYWRGDAQSLPNYIGTTPLSTMKLSTAVPIAIIAALAPAANAGPAAYGICQAGCSAVVTACYAAGGATWGATLGATAPATIVGCNSAFGACQAACWASLLAPTL
ncbi:hypothetical protein F4775DRAFT_590835 [Biscogniauxia sp. FL1348]|nr:hypothetical protein F4775DRAFT_590835 [Biscogniauxia sp. FL1348]